jgi:hypothetical protein
MYTETMNIKTQIEKLDSDNVSISKNFADLEKNINNFMLEHSSCDLDEEDEEDELTEEHTHTQIHKPDMNFFDQLLINSDDLDHLQKIQQEMRGQLQLQQSLDTITEEIDLSDNDNDTVEDKENDYISIQEDQDYQEPEEPEEQEESEEQEEPEISFEKEDTPLEITKCIQILKAGKNKGTVCSKDAIRNTDFCKSHTK